MNQVLRMVKKPCFFLFLLCYNALCHNASASETRRLLKNEREQRRKEGKLLVQQWKEKRREEVKKQQYEGKFADLSFAPSLPTYVVSFGHKNLFNMSLSYQTESSSFGPDGKRSQLSLNELGASSCTLQDILVTSRLLKRGLLQFTGADTHDNFLDALADTQISFDASRQTAILDFNLARYLFKKRMTMGVHLPFVYKRHRLDVRYTVPDDGVALDSMTKTTATGGTVFRKKYGGDIGRFFDDVFARKHMKHERNMSKIGFADLAFFSHINVSTSVLDRCFIGLKVVVPTSPQRNHALLWAPELGNGGITEIIASSGLEINADYNINPYAFLRFHYYPPAKVKRRIPRRVLFDGQSAVDLADLVPFAEQQLSTTGGKGFSQVDSYVQELADVAVPIRLHQGWALNARIGNGFERFILRRGMLDLYYRIMLKKNDVIGSSLSRTTWEPRLCEEDTFSVGHTFGANYTYYFDSSSSCSFDIAYTGMGLNTSEVFFSALSLNFDF